MRASRVFLGATLASCVFLVSFAYLGGWFRVPTGVAHLPTRTRFLFSAAREGRTGSGTGDHRAAGDNRAQDTATAAGTDTGGSQEDESVEKIQSDRRATLEKVCNVSLPAFLPPLSDRQLSHVLVDDKHRIMYCYVPKVACTNWKRVMIKLKHPEIEKLLDITPHDAHYTHNLPSLRRYPPEQAQYRIDNYFKFMFVRDPLERLLSAYINKFTMPYNEKFHRLYGTQIISRYRENPSFDALHSGKDVMFKEFVQYLLDPQAHKGGLNEHWDHYHNLCHPCRIKYNVIGRYETLDQDVDYVLRKAGIDDIIEFPPKPKKTQTNTSQLVDEYLDQIGQMDVLRLYNMYFLDYLMFNYSLPVFPSER